MDELVLGEDTWVGGGSACDLLGVVVAATTAGPAEPLTFDEVGEGPITSSTMEEKSISPLLVKSGSTNLPVWPVFSVNSS